MITKNSLVKLSAGHIYDLAEFVVKENFNHHSQGSFPINFKNEVTSIYEEELNFSKDSEVYVCKDYSGAIIGSIRVLKWNFVDVLPIEKIFSLNPLLLISNPNINEIYHIGRFAIKKEVGDINLFKQLMVCAIAPVCKHTDNVVFAECDSKLLRILNLLGIKTTIVGKSIDYLGSETIPIAMNYNGLIEFYKKNKHLVTSITEDINSVYYLGALNVNGAKVYGA